MRRVLENGGGVGERGESSPDAASWRRRIQTRASVVAIRRRVRGSGTTSASAAAVEARLHPVGSVAVPPSPLAPPQTCRPIGANRREMR